MDVLVDVNVDIAAEVALHLELMGASGPPPQQEPQPPQGATAAATEDSTDNERPGTHLRGSGKNIGPRGCDDGGMTYLASRVSGLRMLWKSVKDQAGDAIKW